MKEEMGGRINTPSAKPLRPKRKYLTTGVTYVRTYVHTYPISNTPS